MIKYILIILFISISVKVLAAPLLTSVDYVMPAPPISTSTLSLYQYLYNIYQHWNTMQITTQEPNGNFVENYGAFLVYYDGTHYWIAMETTAPSGSTWVGVEMGAV